MSGWFRIEVERDAALVRLTMGGFFAAATIDAMRRGVVDAVATLQCPPNGHVTLCDIRDMDIQAQERVEEFARVVGSDDIRSRLLAFVTAKSLARMQAKRLTSRAGVSFFSDVPAAEHWLRQPH